MNGRDQDRKTDFIFNANVWIISLYDNVSSESRYDV